MKLKGGFAFKSSDFLETGDVPVLRISNIKPYGIDLNNAVYIRKELSDKCKEYHVKAGNVVIAMSGATTGKTTTIKEVDLPLVLNQRVGLFSITNEKRLYEPYLAQIVLSKEFLNNMGVNAIGGAQPNISGKQIEDIVINVPPIEQQKKITSILSSIDETIEKTESIIEKIEKVKKGLMQQLLIKGIEHSKFKKTKNGEIPVEWEI
ncbi:restriction endonuclease subunit S, partial [Vibrio parahaemolyticus]|nr:restriction endonuclease subunit S [Vibrio parahaemolyticus]